MNKIKSNILKNKRDFTAKEAYFLKERLVIRLKDSFSFRSKSPQNKIISFLLFSFLPLTSLSALEKSSPSFINAVTQFEIQKSPLEHQIKEIEEKRTSEQEEMTKQSYLDKDKYYQSFSGGSYQYFPEQLSLHESGKSFVADYKRLRSMYTHVLGGLKILPLKVAIDEFEPLVGKNLQHFQESMLTSAQYDYHQLAHAQQEVFKLGHVDKQTQLKSLHKKLDFISQSEHKDLFQKSMIPYLEEALSACEKGRLTDFDFVAAQELQTNIESTLEVLKESSMSTTLWDKTKESAYAQGISQGVFDSISSLPSYTSGVYEQTSNGLNKLSSAQEQFSENSELLYESLLSMKNLEDFTRKYFPHLFDEESGERLIFTEVPIQKNQSLITFSSLSSKQLNIFNTFEAGFLTALLGSENYHSKTSLPLSAHYQSLFHESIPSWKLHSSLKKVALSVNLYDSEQILDSHSSYGFKHSAQGEFLSNNTMNLWLEKNILNSPHLETALLKYWQAQLQEISSAQKKKNEFSESHTPSKPFISLNSPEKNVLDFLCSQPKGSQLLQYLQKSSSRPHSHFLNVDVQALIQLLTLEYSAKLLEHMLQHKFIIIYQYIKNNEDSFNSSQSQMMILKDLNQQFLLAEKVLQFVRTREKENLDKLDFHKVLQTDLSKNKELRFDLHLSKLYQ